MTLVMVERLIDRVDALIAARPARQRKAMLWGVAPTGDPHLGYLPALLTSRLLVQTGMETVLLLADFHAFLDDQKTSWEQLDERTRRYQELLAPSFSRCLRAQAEYLHPRYVTGLIQFSESVELEQAVRFGNGTLRRDSDQRRCSEVLYVLMQLFDLAYFDVGLAICGEDEAPIYRGWEEVSSRSSHNDGVKFMYVPMCPGVEEPEMHASSTATNRVNLDSGREEVEAALERNVQLAGGSLEAARLVSYCAQVVVPLFGRLVDAPELPPVGDNGFLPNLADQVHAALEACRAEQLPHS